MSQAPRRTRVRQLADSVWPGRTVNGYANLIAARLRKLADEKSTGVLPVSGHGDGAIFFRGGQVIYAESSRTPLPAPRAVSLAALGLVPSGDPQSLGQEYTGGAELVAARSVGRVTGALVLTESVIDALTELLSSDSRYAKFRQADDPPAGQVRPMPVDILLTEVQRRHAVLRQLAAVVTPDTPVTREPSLDGPAAQVSPAQWALLARTGDSTTPRGLALQLGRSVFGTTIEVCRLVELGLLAVPGRPGVPVRPAAGGDGPAVPRPPAAVSFIRAVAGERGSDG
jgi:Domain of unknown function (DUF4388)